MRPLDQLATDARFWLSRRVNRSLAPPDWLTINLTLRCNLACVMCTTCYAAPELAREEILDLIDQAALWGIKVFNPLGGEPFVRADLEDILAHAARRDLYTTLTTNATLIRPDRASRIAAIPVEKLHVNISVDGREGVHDRVRGEGSFARTLAGYRRLREADEAAGNPRRVIAANVLLHRGNLPEFPALLGLLAAEGFDAVQVLNLFRNAAEPTTGGMWFEPEDWPALDALCDTLARGESPLPLRNRPEDLRLIPRYYREGLRPLEAACWAGWKELYVNVDGGAIMCDGRLDFLAGRFGSVRTHTLREVWASPALAERRAVVRTCTTPCLQNCYLRRESDSARAIVSGVAAHVGAAVRARLPHRSRRFDGVLTLELSDTSDDPADPRARAFFARSPVSLDALGERPDTLAEVRDRGYLDFGRGFLGDEALGVILDGIGAAGLAFTTLALRWRGEPLLHPELPVVWARLGRAFAAGRFHRVVLETSGRLLGPSVQRLLGEGPVPVQIRVIEPRWAARATDPIAQEALADGPVVSWDGRLTASRADVRLHHKLGNVLEEGFGVVWARVGG